MSTSDGLIRTRTRPVQLAMADYDDYSAISDHFRGQGSKYLNSGCFAAVLTHPTRTDAVVKVFRRDPGYLVYLNYVRSKRHPSSLLPRFFSPPIAYVTESGNEAGFSVEMELLERVPWRIRGVNTDTMRHAATEAIRGINDPIQNVGFKQSEINSLGELKSLLANGARLRKGGSKIQLSGDLHSGNWMYRKSDDSLVLTDPWTSRS